MKPFLYGSVYMIVGILVSITIVRNVQKYCKGFEDFKLEAPYFLFFAMVWPALVIMSVGALFCRLLQKLFPNEVEQ